MSENASIRNDPHHHMEIIYIYFDKHKEHTQLRVATGHKFKTRLCLLMHIRSTRSLTLDMHVQGSLHSCRPMICYVAWTLIPKSTTTPVVPLHHFGRIAIKWAVLKSLIKRSVWLVSHTALRYLPFLPPSHHLQSQWWFGILFITPHIPGGRTAMRYLPFLPPLITCSLSDGLVYYL